MKRSEARLPLSVVVALCLLLLCAGCERPWHVAVLGDADLGSPGKPVPPVFPRILAAIHEQAPDLVFFTGDLVHGRSLLRADTEEQYRLAAGLLSGLCPRLFVVPGNHDVDGAGGRETFEAHFGRTPWAFGHRGWRFIGLDTEEPGFRGEIAGEQLRWLQEELGRRKRCRGTVVFLHRPVWPTPLAEGRVRSLPRPELHRLLAGAGVSAVFAGHEHRFHQEVRDGVLYVITGGAGASLLDGAAHHFSLVEIRGRRLDVRDVRPQD